MSDETKNYALRIPMGLYNEVKQVADNHHTTVLEMLKKFIKLGLVLVAIEKKPDTMIIIREGESEREIVLM